MKVVFDTNILVSGFLTVTGLPQYVFSLALKRHTVILSKFILEEFRGVLTQKFEIPSHEVNQAVEFLSKRVSVIEIRKRPKTRFSDLKDVPILNLIEAAKPNYFVTGDKKLLAMKKLGSTLFLSPREAVEVL